MVIVSERFAKNKEFEKRLVVVCSIEHVKNECKINGTISLIAFPCVFSFSLLVLS